MTLNNLVAERPAASSKLLASVLSIQHKEANGRRRGTRHLLKPFIQPVWILPVFGSPGLRQTAAECGPRKSCGVLRLKSDSDTTAFLAQVRDHVTERAPTEVR
jgi:hypothetical protein